MLEEFSNTKELTYLKSKKYSALIGNPTEHSISDIMFSRMVGLFGLPFDYQHVKINIQEDLLGYKLRELVKENYSGFNITLPYKISVLKLLDRINSTAKAVGAVNTIKNDHNRLCGYNTDWCGIYQLLVNNNKDSFCVFGTGGACRAAIFAARKLAAKKIYIVYRDKPLKSQNTENLIVSSQNVSELHLVSYDRMLEAIDDSTIIINATSAGMLGMPSPTPFDTDLICGLDVSKKIFFDFVFNPVHTSLFNYFKDKGATTIDGLWLMIYQGINALSLWLDCEVQPTEKILLELHDELEIIINKRMKL